MIDDNKLCATCALSGVVRKAHRILANGKGICDEHWRASQGMPPAIITHRPTCEGCREQGKHVPATVVMNGLNLCDGHAKSASIADGPPVALEPQDVEVKERKTTVKKIDYQAAQRDRDGGMSVLEVAKKYGVSDASMIDAAIASFSEL